MKTFKLVIDGPTAWTSFFIRATDNAEARKRAARIAASCAGESFTLMLDGVAIDSGRARHGSDEELSAIA